MTNALAPLDPALHKNLANAIRALSMDAVQAANSGHPGMPMGMADVAAVLFTRHLKFAAQEPKWFDRDRFVLSAGHGSMLLYSALYLTGYSDITMDDLKAFRQLGSKTAGHPEYGELAGIETTTGPLGQGFATAVGMAIAERVLAARFGSDVVDHYTYVLAGDGDLMEGISQEALSLAGHLALSKLIVLFDDNGISIDGPVSLSDTTDQPARFQASGWHVLEVDGHDANAIDAALTTAKQSTKPTLICCKTRIGYGAPNKEGSASSHGSPLGDAEIEGARAALGWPYPPFEVPEDVLAAWRAAGRRGDAVLEDWNGAVRGLTSDAAEAFNRLRKGTLPDGIADRVAALCQELAEAKPAMATRKASERALNVLTQDVPEMIGGSADLTGSNNTKTDVTQPITADDFSGRFLHYGIREHAMAAAMNGMALHGGIIPYSGTFLVFSDYCRPSIRLSALMKQRVVYVMTHDSIGLGEDGPTHQPVEHLASLRAMPNLNVFRPADTIETAECWLLALQSTETPSVLALTRQNVPAVRLSYDGENLCRFGAYELAAADGTAQVSLFATGSEVHLALEARDALQAKGIATRVVSVPCWELFDQQDDGYKQSVLGSAPVRIAIEAGVELGWHKYLGDQGAFIGMTGFGTSAPYQDAYEHFGITVQAVTAKAEALIATL